MGTRGCRAVAALAAATLSGALATSARAEFPFPGGIPNDLQGKLEWMYAATPEPLEENPV